MDSSQIDSLVKRLVSHPHDEEALAQAHHSGAADPKSYALLLERVGAETRDPAYASHWLSEAANVWSVTLGDAHRAARVLMQAIDRDPTQRIAADRLSQLYRDKGDVKALVALLERRAKALGPLASQSIEIREELGRMHEELGRLWNESLQQPRKAVEHFRRAAELAPNNLFAASSAREIYSSLGMFDDAILMSEVELALEVDRDRQLALLREQAAMHRAANDLSGATHALARARQIDDRDPALQQEYGGLVVERLTGGEDVPAYERTLGAELLVGLAEIYDGEHGLAYSAGALDIDPGHDRALQLYAYYAHAVEREEQVTSRYLAYLQANPQGTMANDARWLLATSYEAAEQIENAIVILEPLGSPGDSQAVTKLRELYARIGRTWPDGDAEPEASARQPSEMERELEREPEASPEPEREAPPSEEGEGEAEPSHEPEREAEPSEPPTRSEEPEGEPDPVQGVSSPEPTPVDPLQAALDAAQAFASAGQSAEALEKYSEVLERDPAHPDAFAWVRGHLRAKRDHAALRGVLVAAARARDVPVAARNEHLREVANLSEGELHDLDGAIGAYTEILAHDPTDDEARQARTRVYEKAQRWDDLAKCLEEEVNAESDLQRKVAIEKKIGALHEQKRRDPLAAAEAWERVAKVSPDDDQAIAAASRLFEQGGSIERAARVISDNAGGLTDKPAQAALLERLGGLREQLSEFAAAGEAYGEAAEAAPADRLWEAAERCFGIAGQWSRAGHCAMQRAELADDARKQAAHLARAADHFARVEDETGVVASLDRAIELDPTVDDYAHRLAKLYASAENWSDLATLLVRRSDRLTDKSKRVESRRQAALLYSSKLDDKNHAREAWLKVLEDGDDKEALEHLTGDALERRAPSEAAMLLRRLGQVETAPLERAAIALREAEILADALGDVDGAIERYEYILEELDPVCRPALQAVADLQEARDQPAAAASALERELKLVSEIAERGPIASRLARLYEQLEDPRGAIRSLEIVRASDPEDFDALARLYPLCEATKQWGKAAELLAQLIEVEGDEAETAVLTRKLARILADELGRGDEALAALTEVADLGDESVRAAYVELGDRLGWRGIVATKLVEWWFEAKPSSERNASLRGAFDRFVEVGREEDAVHVACEIVRGKGADHALAEELEKLAIKTRNLDALAIAHDLLARELTGIERARELARQGETRVEAGAPRSEALQHGESGLTGVAPGEAEELLARLAALAEQPGDVVSLYERQIARSKAPIDRVKALARAAQVAASHGDVERARAFFDLALAGNPPPETLAILEEAARASDTENRNERLRRALSAAMAAGGQGARDGGRTRGALLRRAAMLVQSELGDVEQALSWLGDALIAHVDPLTLDALEALSGQVGDPSRCEEILSQALSEVSDTPLVRQLLARRAKWRRTRLGDVNGAAVDLKRLHELSPTDQGVADELSTLLVGLGDHSALVQLYEDLILRGKDMTVRIDLARTVARMWEGQLDDPREAADAWRRVLRMKPGDTDATTGLERAKANMLRRRDASQPGSEHDLASSRPLPPPRGEADATPPGPPETTRAGTDAVAAAAGREEMDTLSPEGEEGRSSQAGEEEIVMADDLAEVIDLDELPAKAASDAPPTPAAEPPPKRRKRIVPPPLPRE